jgi:uncharacterized membrane protein
MPSSSKLYAFVFSDSQVPADVYEQIHRWHNQGTIDVQDVSEFEIKENGKIKFERAMTLPLLGATDGYFLEALVGLIFFQAPHSKNVERAIAELRLDKAFIQGLLESAVPGATLLFLRVDAASDESVLRNLAAGATGFFKMSLAPEQESKLELLFHGKQNPEYEAPTSQLH